MRFVVVIAALGAVLSSAVLTGCGRENFLLIGMTRTEGGSVESTSLQYDQQGHPTKVVKSDGEGEEATVFEELALTWTDGVLAGMVKTQFFGDFAFITTTTLSYDQDVIVGAESTSRGAEDEADRDPRRTESFVLTYDKAKRIETVTREAADENGDTERQVLTLTNDVPGLIEVKNDVENKNVGEADEAFVEVTSVTYEKDKPVTLATSVDDERPTTFDVKYKGATIDQIDVVIPDNNEFGEEITRSGAFIYAFDEEERMDSVRIEEDERDDIELAFVYTDGSASGLDTTPTEITPLRLWDMRGTSFKAIDSRTQAARIIGAAW